MAAKTDIFIAARDKVQLETLRQLFRGMGQWGIASATEASKAHEALRASAPATILICEGLAGADAASFVQMLRQDHAVPSRKSHMLYVGPKEAHAIALRHGAHACIGWPISLADLMKALAALKSDTRPFVEHAVYVGPCRRTKSNAGRGVPQRRESDKSGMLAQLAAVFEEHCARFAQLVAAAKADPAAGAGLFEGILKLQRLAKDMQDKSLEDATAALAEAMARRSAITPKVAGMLQEYVAALAHLHRSPDNDERLMLAVLVVALAARIDQLMKADSRADQAASNAAARAAK